VTAEEGDRGASAAENLRHQKAQPAVAEDGHPGLRLDVNLLQDLEGGGERLDENGRPVGDGLGYPMEIAPGKRQKIGEGSVPALDSEDGPLRTVPAEALPA
jgi:hypothetical protein